MYMNYSTRHICQLFNISPQTTRAWTEEFQEYLSENARPGVGRHRQFTEDDMRVLSLISQMKRDSSATFADIHASLKVGQRGTPPALPPSEVEALVLSERESQLIFQLQKLQQTIADLEKERLELLPTRDEALKLRTVLETKEARIAELTEELKAARDEIRKLDREIGRLESRVDE
jgi:DNA-binding transcriptional MerR regulator